MNLKLFQRLSRLVSRPVELAERCTGKLARTVLRGLWRGATQLDEKVTFGTFASSGHLSISAKL